MVTVFSLRQYCRLQVYLSFLLTNPSSSLCRSIWFHHAYPASNSLHTSVQSVMIVLVLMKIDDMYNYSTQMNWDFGVLQHNNILLGVCSLPFAACTYLLPWHLNGKALVHKAFIISCLRTGVALESFHQRWTKHIKSNVLGTKLWPRINLNVILCTCAYTHHSIWQLGNIKVGGLPHGSLS